LNIGTSTYNSTGTRYLYRYGMVRVYTELDSTSKK
jgi:hypothetical protein